MNRTSPGNGRRRQRKGQSTGDHAREECTVEDQKRPVFPSGLDQMVCNRQEEGNAEEENECAEKCEPGARTERSQSSKKRSQEDDVYASVSQVYKVTVFVDVCLISCFVDHVSPPFPIQ